MFRALRRLRLALHLAVHLVRSKRSKRLSTVTWISMVGVAFGVLALTTVLAVTGGFQTAFRDRILGLYPHIVVLKRAGDFRDWREASERLRGTAGVEGVMAATMTDMMLASEARRAGAVVKGVELAHLADVLPVAELVSEGRVEALEEAPRARLERGAGHVVVEGVVAGMAATVLVHGDGQTALVEEDRTPPGPGHARVALLDLRAAPDARAAHVLLAPADDVEAADEGRNGNANAPLGDPADGDGREPQSPRAPGGGAVDPASESVGPLQRLLRDGPPELDAAGRPTRQLEDKALGEPLALAGDDGLSGDDPFARLDLRAPVPLPQPAGVPLGRAVDVTAGDWVVRWAGVREDARDGPVLWLAEGTRVTVALMDGPGGAAAPPRWEAWVSEGELRVPEGAARVRLAHAAPELGTLTLATVGASGEVAPDLELAAAPGGFTPFGVIQGDLPGVILGKDLARKLDVGLEDTVSLLAPVRGLDRGMFGGRNLLPRSARHRVVGLFDSGFHEYDVRLALVGLKAAQRLIDRGDTVRWLEVAVTDLMRVGETERRAAAALDPYGFDVLAERTRSFSQGLDRLASGEIRHAQLQPALGLHEQFTNAQAALKLLKYQEVDLGHRPRHRLVDWESMNANLLGALRLQKVVLTIFFLIIIVVASLVVVGSQVMVVHEKTADIAILKAMGASRGVVRLAFTLQGLLVAGVGTVAGGLAGMGLVALIGALDYQLDASVYLIDRLPVQLDAFDVALVVAATAVCTAVATQYSAGRAARKTVVDGLRVLD